MRWPLVCVGALVVVLACHREQKPRAAAQVPSGEVWLSAAQMQTSQIAAAPVARRRVEIELSTSGRVVFDDLHVVHVFSPVSGRVTQILAHPGQRVTKGAPLLMLESPDVGAAFSDVAKAEADLSAADRELKRQRELFEVRANAEKDLEQAQNAFDRARAELARARQRAELFRGYGLDQVTQQLALRSPIAGEVIARNVNPGTDLAGQYSGGGAIELFTIGSIDIVWVLADVFETDMARIAPGAPVTISVVAYPGKIFEGRIDWISGSLDPTSHTVRVRCAIRNPDHELKPEMYATVNIGVQGADTLAIPRSAVLRVGDQTVVFVETGVTETGMLRFTRRPVRVNEAVSGDLLPVLSGIGDGDSVVVEGAVQLLGMT
jgi:cobalt-zinc-cadmium efflux system membrane fusion protein